MVLHRSNKLPTHRDVSHRSRIRSAVELILFWLLGFPVGRGRWRRCRPKLEPSTSDELTGSRSLETKEGRTCELYGIPFFFFFRLARYI
ncbi:hypothetical protein CEXT_308971 [Caerostris extrusa]|uniref:Uncharacterized protein n=1 Tax=Caerostris extrusa TaxID=172846 RepID=A0AAV4QT41_CAEEX|nr:hypothetical protein CEXT_308971 [Caerostris extrusa]